MKKSKKISSQKNKSQKKHKDNKSKNSRNCNNNQDDSNTKTSKLCAFSSVDYIILASTLAIALGEELSADDINILASFFAVLSDELALISSVEVCNEGDETSVFIPPDPDVAITSLSKKKK